MLMRGRGSYSLSRAPLWNVSQLRLTLKGTISIDVVDGKKNLPLF